MPENSNLGDAAEALAALRVLLPLLPQFPPGTRRREILARLTPDPSVISPDALAALAASMRSQRVVQLIRLYMAPHIGGRLAWVVQLIHGLQDYVRDIIDGLRTPQGTVAEQVLRDHTANVLEQLLQSVVGPYQSAIDALR